MSLRQQFQDTLTKQQPAVLRSIIANTTTVKDLRALLTAHPELSNITLDELCNPPKRLLPKTPKVVDELITKVSYKRAKFNLRTAEGRDALDEAVYAILEAAGPDAALASSDIKINATPAQLRASLARLIEQERVTWSGQARGTRYSVL